MLTQELLKEALHYNPETGIFTWLNRTSNRINVGDAAGSVDSNGYILIRVYGFQIRAHRLAWLYMNGEFPPCQIDHIDGNRANNSIRNLRDATNAENASAKHFEIHNKTGHTGIYFRKETAKYVARITANGSTTYIGSFNSLEEAVTKRKEIKLIAHPFSRS